MGLKDRLEGQKKLSEEQEKSIIGGIKDRIKKGNVFFNKAGFYDREDFKDKLYVMINSEIENRYPFSDYEIEDRLIERMLSEIFGLGILERYMQDRMVTDIFIQDKEMIVIKSGVKEYLGEVFSSLEEVYLIIDRIKDSSGKTVDQRIPFLNTELYDGSRCQVVIPPVSDKVYISIRVFNCIDFKIEDLLRLGMFDSKRFKILKNFVEERKNILMSTLLSL